MGKGRTPCCDKSQVKRGPWSPSEDMKLITFIQKHGHQNWRALPKLAGLLRCGKSCRLRWINYLRPDVKRGNYTQEEEDTIIKLQDALGNKWSKIASYLPGRTDNEIKNVWNTHLKKKLALKTDASKSPFGCSSDSFSSSSSSSVSYSCGKEETAMETIHQEGPITDKTSHQLKNAETSLVEASSSKMQLEHEGRTKDGEMNKDEVVEIPLEADTDFWNMLDGLDPFRSSNNSDLQRIEACPASPKDEGDGHAKWFHCFDKELSGEDQNY